MTKFKFAFEKPGLLVSVRNAEEALAALAGGADVIDVKEPSRGSLGAADGDTIADVVRAVGGRAPVSVALGELIELAASQNGNGHIALADGVSLFKIGLANCSNRNDWQKRWQQTITAIGSESPPRDAQPVAVVYADWSVAHSPPPQAILIAAIEHRCPALLIDTWSKSGGTLFDYWDVDGLRSFLSEVRSHGIAVVLAGSLTRHSIVGAARLAPDLVAVRTAACDGGREGTVSENKVRELKNTLETATRNMAVI